MVSSGQVREAYEKYVHPNFRHHNAYFKGDRESLLVAMEEAHIASPNKSLVDFRIKWGMTVEVVFESLGYD